MHCSRIRQPPEAIVARRVRRSDGRAVLRDAGIVIADDRIWPFGGRAGCARNIPDAIGMIWKCRAAAGAGERACAFGASRKISRPERRVVVTGFDRSLRNICFGYGGGVYVDAFGRRGAGSVIALA